MSIGRLIIGIILVIAGLSALFNINIWKFIGPLFLIWLGWIMLSGSSRRGDKNIENSDHLNETFIFSGIKKKLQGTNFEGGNLTTIFGGAEFDLRDVKTKSKKIMIDAVAIFGGIKIHIPETWQVTSEQVQILGGFSDKTHRIKNPQVILTVKGISMFGGTEVVN